MEFQIGKMLIKLKEGDLTIVAPIGDDHMIAVDINMFEMPLHNSISLKGEIYHKEDSAIVKRVQSWLNNGHSGDSDA